DAVRPAAEADRQHAADRRRTLLPGDIAVVRGHQRLAQTRSERKRRLLAAPLQCRVGRFVALAEDHVGAIDDAVRPWLPAVFGALLAVVAGRLPHRIEGAVRDPEPKTVARGEFAGLRAGPEGIFRQIVVR